MKYGGKKKAKFKVGQVVYSSFHKGYIKLVTVGSFYFGTENSKVVYKFGYTSAKEEGQGITLWEDGLRGLTKGELGK